MFDCRIGGCSIVDRIGTSRTSSSSVLRRLASCCCESGPPGTRTCFEGSMSLSGSNVRLVAALVGLGAE